MFRRIIWEDVMRDLQTGGLFLLGVAIVLLLARVLTAPKDEVRRLSEMPLNDE